LEITGGRNRKPQRDGDFGHLCILTYLFKEETIMKPIAYILVLLLAALPAVASAEFYRYVDEEGNAHYTDDLSRIPPDQLPKIDQYEEAEREPASEEKVLPQEKKTSSTTSSPETEGREGTRSDLRERGAALEAEYEALMEERGQLDKASQEAKTPEERRELAEKIEAFNERMADYRKRRESFNKEVEAYNASLKEEAPSPKGEAD
jgi:hypothetical protein